MAYVLYGALLAIWPFQLIEYPFVEQLTWSSRTGF